MVIGSERVKLKTYLLDWRIKLMELFSFRSQITGVFKLLRL